MSNNYLLKKKKILVTTAFIYSNGHLHLGHMIENIQADIYVRFNRIIGNIVYFISSDDSHGTPIIIKSMDLNISPKKLIKKFYKSHVNDFKKYSISFDFYGSTNSKENNKFLLKIYTILNKKKFIFKKKISQFYDNIKKIFLPDRLIIGICPRCKSNNQYGDNCNFCNYVYNPTDLINPKSTLTKSIPVIKRSNHIFINISKLQQKILYILKKNIIINKFILKKCLEWFNFKLKPWNISRNSPYFGFKIPNSNKFFYVWIDAIVGYISTFKILCKSKKINYNEFWNNKEVELFQFIGKDIIYFHTIFWPFILEIINFKIPNKIFVHGHLKIKNKKISKSSINYITANNISNIINTDYIRYYFASKLSNNINDINFNFSELKLKINNNLINKILNLASRSSYLINKNFNGILISNLKMINNSPYNLFINISDSIWFLYSNLEYKKIIDIIEILSNISNKYLSINQPWKLKNKIKSQSILSISIYLFKIIIIYLKPIIPKISKYVESFLNIKLTRNNLYQLFSENHKINIFNKYKFQKITINTKKYFNI